MGTEEKRRTLPTREGFLAYCVMSGAAATLAGAAASLLAGGAQTRLLVWLVVTMTVACAAGIWWGRKTS